MDSNVGDVFKSRVLTGVASTALGTLAPMMISLFGVMLVLRWLEPQDYGAYLMLMVLVQLASTLSELGIRSSLVHALQQREPASVKRLMMNTCLLGSGGLSILASLVTLLLRGVILKLFDFPLLGALLWYLPFVLLLTNVNNTIQGVLQGLHHYRTLMLVRLMSAAIRFVAVIGFVRLLSTGAWGLLYADLLSIAASLVVSLLVVSGVGRPEFATPLIRRILRFGMPLYLNNLLSFTFNKVDVMMIGAMADASSVANVEVAARIPTNLKQVISNSFMTVFFPHMAELFAKGERQAASRFMEMSLRLMSFWLMFVALSVAMFEKEIVVLVFSGRYMEVGAAFTIFMMALPFGTAGTIMGTTLVAGGFSSAPVKINLVAVSANIMGNLVLIPILGFTGAALATFLMMVITLPVNQWYLRRKLFSVEDKTYLFPVFLGLALWGMRHALSWDLLPVRMSIPVLYALLGALMMPQLRQDLRKVFKQLRSMRSAAGRSDAQDN